VGEIYRHLQERCEGQIGNEETYSHTVTDIHGDVVISVSREMAKVVKSNEGSTYYIDLERIRKVDGYVYWWDLTDL